MTIPTSVAQLTQQLKQDTHACESLLDLLNQEKEALANRDMDRLDQLIAAKTEQLELLENSARQRTEWARQYLGAGNADVKQVQEAWQSMLETANVPEITATWERLKELQQSCKAANEVNGKILARNHKTFERLLGIVRGQTTTPNLYSASGKSTASHISHKVGEA